MQIRQRIFKCTDMQIMHFILDKILKLSTHYSTCFSTISRCKVIVSDLKNIPVFLAHPVFKHCVLPT